jgi:hypothetical protein
MAGAFPFIRSTGWKDTATISSGQPEGANAEHHDHAGASATPCDDGRVTSAQRTKTTVDEVSRAELVHGLDRGHVTLVDVLSPESFASMHIPGAINLPVVDLARHAAVALPDRRARIVTYCGGPT